MPEWDQTPRKRSVAEMLDETSVAWCPPPPSLLRHKKPLCSSSPSTSSSNNSQSSTTSDSDNNDQCGITVSDIAERARRIFKQHDERFIDVMQLPCLSARLFACYTLATELHQQSQPSVTALGSSTLLCSTRFEQAIRHIRPILPFLSALVRVELMSLCQDETLSKEKHHPGNHHHHNTQNHNVNGSDQKHPPRIRKVQFSGFDCSSTQPPSDTRLGSHVHRQRCSDALVEALEQARALQAKLQTTVPTTTTITTTTTSKDDHDENDNDNMPPIVTQEEEENFGDDDKQQPQPEQLPPVPANTTTNMDTAEVAAAERERLQIVECLQSMVDFFKDLTCKSPFVAVCAQSIHSTYPAARVSKAIDLYRHEFSILLQSATTATSSAIITTTTKSTSTLLPKSQVLFVHQKLVSFLAQDIRYQLRTLFNPAPYNAVDKGVDRHHSKRSLVPDLVQLYSAVHFVKGKNKKKERATDDAVISCVVSTALQRIYDFLGRDVCLQLDESYATSSIPVPTGFCQSAASLRGLVDPVDYKRNGRLSISTATSNTSTSSTTSSSFQEDLQIVLQDVKQAFLYLSATRAAQFLLDLLKADGVDQAIHSVGGWSTIEHNAQLMCQYASYCCPEDNHFVLLAHVPLLVQVLEDLFCHQESTVEQCQQALQDVFRRFKCGDQGRIRKRFPQIAMLANAYDDMNCLSQFPLVQSTLSPNDDILYATPTATFK